MAASAAAGSRRRVGAHELPRGAAELDVRLFPALPPGRLVFSPAMFVQLKRAARDFDVVHIHSLFLFPQFAAWRAARRARVPYIVSPRGALDPWLRRRNATVKAIADAAWQRRFLEQAALLHLTSGEEARQAAGVAPRVPRAVVPNGVRWSEYERLPSADAFRHAYLHGNDAPIVLFMGRISAKKGIDLLVRAFAAVRREFGDAWLVIAGPDDERLTRSLRALALHEGVADRVVFTGMLRGDAKLAALAAADVWALPSRGENFGNAVVEAMAASRAVLVSAEVNIAMDIALASAGVVAERSVDAFAEGITMLLRDGSARTALGVAARAFAQRYDWARVAPQLAAMYESVVEAENVAA
jgi:glycosyltransferase involved in cell wall biosynthesis